MTQTLTKTTETMPTTTQTVVQTGIIRPIVTTNDALTAWKEYENLKSAIATPSDIQRIQGKDFLKKSFWRKMAKFHGLSLTLIREILKDDTWYVMYRATARTGDFCDGDGACSFTEKTRTLSHHDARATAHTRAKNRAIADLIGGGEVSAEEVSATNGFTKTHTTTHTVTSRPVTDKQLSRLWAITQQNKWTSDQVKAQLKTMFGLTTTKDLTMAQYDQLVTKIETEVV